MEGAREKYRIQVTVGQALAALTLLSVALAAGREVLNADGEPIQMMVLALLCCAAGGAFVGTFVREALLGAFAGYCLFTLVGLALLGWLALA
jgi:hypothetical protein